SCFRGPLPTVVSGIVLFFVAIGLGLLVSISNLNEVATSRMNVFITMPQGATLESTDVKTRAIEEKVMAIPGVENVISQVSEGDAVLTVELVDELEDVDDISVEDVRNR